MNRSFWLAIAGLNLLLAFAALALVPQHTVATTDRQGYEWVAQHGLAPDCPHLHFCYRVLAPGLVSHLPLPPPTAWALVGVLANAAAGLVLAVACARLASPPRQAAVLASVMAQTSFGFTFAIFDPYTPDPLVFLAGALLLWAWIDERPLVALGVGLVGVFAKETVALLAIGLALAALMPPRSRGWWLWVAQALVAGGVLVAFHVAMDRLAGWSLAGSASADLAAGAWLALWVRDQQPLTALFLVFMPFGFGWLFAALGLAAAPDRLRRLALGLLLPLLVLVYVQNVERALGNAFLVVVPAATVFLLARAPFRVALLTVVANGLLTARVGLSTSLLPAAPVLLLAAAAAAGWTLLRAHRLRAVVPATLLALALAACSTPGGSTPVPAPTATAEALATQARQRADADVRRISAFSPTQTPTPSPTPVPPATCDDGAALWWYEARSHIGEAVTVEGPVVRVRQVDGGRGLLELGQYFPDPTGLSVLVDAPVPESQLANATVCASGRLVNTDGGPTLQVANAAAVRVVTPRQ